MFTRVVSNSFSISLQSMVSPYEMPSLQDTYFAQYIETISLQLQQYEKEFEEHKSDEPYIDKLKKNLNVY